MKSLLVSLLVVTAIAFSPLCLFAQDATQEVREALGRGAEEAEESATTEVETVGVEDGDDASVDVEDDADAEDSEGQQTKRGIVGGLRGILDILSTSESERPGVDSEESNEILKEQERKISELRRQAASNIEKDRVEGAISSLNELISMKPYDPDYHLAVGLCYRKRGSYKEALEKYDDVLDLGGDRALVALLRAESFTVQGDRDKAFEALREAAVLGRNIINDMRILKPLNQFQNDTDFIKLALSLENVQVDVTKIKDPFTNPFPQTNPQDDGDEFAQEPVFLEPEEQEELLEEAKRTYERVKFYIKLEDENKAMNSYLQMNKMLEKKSLLTIPKIISDFRILSAKMPAVEVEIEGIRLKYYYRQAQEKLRQMKEIFLDGEYDRVAQVHNEVIRLTEEMRATNADYRLVADRIVEASNLWFNRANVRREFEGLRPRIQGIIISGEGKMAVLNDRVVKQGEFFEDLRVVKVQSNKVTFRYKGEEIPIVFRRY